MPDLVAVRRVLVSVSDKTDLVPFVRGLLDAGVEVNVIRGWLGHASLRSTHRYAEINARAKEAALRACAPPTAAVTNDVPSWRGAADLLAWLEAL